MRLPLYATGLILIVSISQETKAASIPIGDWELNLNGYFREWLSLNLNDHPELNDKGEPIRGAGELSMARSTFLVQGQIQTGPLFWFAQGRFSREPITNYLNELENTASSKGAPTNLQDHYNENDLREFYVDFNPTDRLHFRIGKQQVVWGETDFFQAMDVIHGYDNSIVQFQTENEEWRKPLWLINVEYSLYELGGSLQIIVRPGIDAGSDLGNTLDFFGGRWASQPNKGNNTLAIFPYNFHHKKGDEDDPSYGLRWYGDYQGWTYSLNYYHTLNQEPILNSAINPYGTAPRNGAGEFIFPAIDVYGGTLSKEALGGAFRIEAAYTPNKPYNFGQIGTLAAGANGVREKDTLRLMAGYDRPLRGLTFHSNSPTNLSLQLFDTWILGFRDTNEIVDFTAKKREHSVIGTMIYSMNFRHDTIQPSVAVLHDLSYGGGLVIPGVNFNPGNHWRIRAEAYLFYLSGGTCATKPDGLGAGCTHLFGTYANNNQFVTRITYQF